MQTGKEIKKKLVWNEKKQIETGKFYINLFMPICTRGNSSHREPRSCFFLFFVFAGTSLFSYILFFFDIETKLKQWISQNTEEKLLYCTHCHTNVWSHLISLFYYSQLRFDFILQSFLTSRRKIVKSRICKSSFRIGLRRWRYLRTRKKFFWCF